MPWEICPVHQGEDGGGHAHGVLLDGAGHVALLDEGLGVVGGATKYLVDTAGKWSAQAANDYMVTLLGSYPA